MKAEPELGSLGAGWGLGLELAYRLSSLLASSQARIVLQIFLKLLSIKRW